VIAGSTPDVGKCSGPEVPLIPLFAAVVPLPVVRLPVAADPVRRGEDREEGRVERRHLDRGEAAIDLMNIAVVNGDIAACDGFAAGSESGRPVRWPRRLAGEWRT
jgi:hypothetical protein